MSDELDAHLKGADLDRWLATRFMADAQARSEVVALYNLDLELAAVAQRATNPLMGEIRFAWWRERLEALAAGRPGADHPVLIALAPALADGRFALAALEEVVLARHAELSDPWFEGEADLDRYLDAVDGAVAVMAVTRLDPGADPASVAAAARLAGLGRLLRRPPPSAGAAVWWPQSWRDAAAGADGAAEVLRHLDHKLSDLRRAARAAARLSPAGFPAIAHASLALNHRRGPLVRRGRMLAAIVAGRI